MHGGLNCAQYVGTVCCYVEVQGTMPHLTQQFPLVLLHVRDQYTYIRQLLSTVIALADDGPTGHEKWTSWLLW
jgi:hypothetical protein